MCTVNEDVCEIIGLKLGNKVTFVEHATNYKSEYGLLKIFSMCNIFINFTISILNFCFFFFFLPDVFLS